MVDIDLTDKSDFDSHSTQHQSGGSDSLNVEGLPGKLADAQDPLSHDNAAHTTNFVADGDVGVENGVAGLNGSGVIPNTQIPDLAITNTFTVTTESDLTTLSSAQVGDVGIVTAVDPTESYILTGSYDVQSDWTRIAVEQAPIKSVNGYKGDVDLSNADVGAASDNHDNTAHSQTYAVDGDAQPPQSHDNAAHTTNYSADSHDHSGTDSPSQIAPDKVDAGSQLDPPTVATRSDIPSGQTGLYYVEDEDTITYRVS